MATRILNYISLPLLLVIGALATFLTFHFQWNFEVAILGIFLFTALYVLLLERIIPLKSEWRNLPNEYFSDLKYLPTTAAFDGLGKAVALSIVLLFQKTYFSGTNLLDRLYFIPAFILANIIGEFLPYLYHRISHKGKTSSFISLFLWQTHSIHHIPESMNWFKTSWIHPVNMFLNTFLKYGSLLVLGFSPEVIFAVGILHVIVAYSSHANILAKTGFLDYIIVTPRIHHFHHSKKIHEAKNFGNILPFWDLVFGTYFNRKGTVSRVGLQKASYTYPERKAFLKQMAFPFYTLKNCCMNKT